VNELLEQYRARVGRFGQYSTKKRCRKFKTNNPTEILYICILLNSLNILLQYPPLEMIHKSKGLTEFTLTQTPLHKNKYSKGKKSQLVILSLTIYYILMLSGDVETNPGPDTRINNGIDVMYLNAQSLKAVDKYRSKMQDFHNIIYSHMPHLVAVSETWFTEQVPESELINQDLYLPYRVDRIFDKKAKKSKGGGVLLLVDINIKSDRKKDLECTSKEHNEVLVVEVNPKDCKKFIVITTYRSQKDPEKAFLKNIENTMLNCLNAGYTDFLLLGDFNYSKITWRNEQTNLPPDSKEFINMLHRYGLVQSNLNPSRASGPNILDLVISNFNTKLSKVIARTYPFDSDHASLNFSINIKWNSMSTMPRTVYNFKRANMVQLKIDLFDANLVENISNLENIDLMLDKWTTIVMGIINNNIPKIKLKNGYSAPWIDAEVIHLIRKKNTLLKKAKDTDTLQSWQKFKHCRNRVKNLIANKYNRYMDNVYETIKDKPKRFWSLLKEKN